MSLADQPALLWRRSRRCNPAECVEVAFWRNHVLVRDSKNLEAGVLQFTRDTWRAFLHDLSQGSLPVRQPAPPAGIRPRPILDKGRPNW